MRKIQLSILLTVISLLLWSHSVLYARLEIGHWGLISGLPVTFFIALAFLTIASAILWLDKENHGKLLCLQLLILLISIGTVPLITGGSLPVIDHGYRNLGYVDYILRQNHFDTGVSQYYSWPGVFILSAIIAKIGLINLEPVITIMPIFLAIPFLLPLYAFFRNILGEYQRNLCWAACWLFSLALWNFPAYPINTGSTALFLLLVVLAMVTNPSLRRRDTRSYALMALIVLSFAGLAITHLLTSLAAMAMIAVLLLIRLNKRLAAVPAACLVVLIVWNLSGAGGYVERRIVSEGYVLVEQVPATAEKPTGQTPASAEATSRALIIVDPDILMDREITSHISGSESHADVARMRILFVGLFFLIGLGGLISALASKENLKTTISILAITVIPLALLTLSGHYDREILTRIYIFALPGMAYFGARLLHANIKRRAVLAIMCLLLIMAVPLRIISQYGNQELDYFSPAQLSGLVFFHNHTSHGLAVGSFSMGRMENRENYREIGLEELEWSNRKLVLDKRMEQYLPWYIAIERQERARYNWFRGNTKLVDDTERFLKSAANCDFIYNNPDFRLYICDE